MNVLGTEISSRDLILGIGVIGLILVSFWFHSQAMSMGYNLSSIPCKICH